MKTIKLEYIWLDGYTPEPNLRSKTKVLDVEKRFDPLKDELPRWSFDGSSTKQAEGNFSDCILKPVRCYVNPISEDSYLVMCEVFIPDDGYKGNGPPHASNMRHHISKENTLLWFGYEQEYTLMHDGKPVGFPKDGYPEPQGKYYCGVGNGVVHARAFAEEHMENCLKAGISVTGINAEVMPGQWEYQVLSHGPMKAGDDLWISRYILFLMSEKYGYSVELHPKPVQGDWNGSGLHCNFSSTEMRGSGGEDLFMSIFNVFESRHAEHIDSYGSCNEMRLTGLHETQSIDKFTWGVSDRGASIRVPLSTFAKHWQGYLEDRRPASNADPYRICKVIQDSLDIALQNAKSLNK